MLNKDFLVDELKDQNKKQRIYVAEELFSSYIGKYITSLVGFGTNYYRSMFNFSFKYEGEDLIFVDVLIHADPKFAKFFKLNVTKDVRICLTHTGCYIRWYDGVHELDGISAAEYDHDSLIELYNDVVDIAKEFFKTIK